MFDKKFWDKYYQTNHTPWDMGFVSPPLKAYIDQLTDKTKNILIPGAGNSYEAEYLWESGFKNLDVLDIAHTPLLNLKKRLPSFPKDHLINEDFFNQKREYDLIFEQTFFCSIDPSKREAYSQQIMKLLKPDGKLVGVFFTFPLDLNQSAPPFGGSIDEYENLFSKYLKILRMETSRNSHPARQDREVFIIAQK